jgi:hypothetical protein
VVKFHEHAHLPKQWQIIELVQVHQGIGDLLNDFSFINLTSLKASCSQCA